MPATGVFFLPPGPSSPDVSPAQVLINRIKGRYPVNPLPNWSLDHRLFRGNPLEGTSQEAVQADAKLQPNRYLQVLRLSTYPGSSYIAVTTTTSSSQTRAGTPVSSVSGAEATGTPANIMAIPSGQNEEFIQLVVTRLGPLWTLRQAVQVIQGQAFEMGDFRIRIGDLKEGHGGAQQVKGIVLEIGWLGADESDWSAAEDGIRFFWSSMNIEGARDFIRVPGLEDGFGTIRQWCEALRLRA